MKATAPSATVAARLKTLGCEQIPPAVREKLEADFEAAVTSAHEKLAEKIITPASVAKAFSEAIRPEKATASKTSKPVVASETSAPGEVADEAPAPSGEPFPVEAGSDKKGWFR